MWLKVAVKNQPFEQIDGEKRHKALPTGNGQKRPKEGGNLNNHPAACLPSRVALNQVVGPSLAAVTNNPLPHTALPVLAVLAA